MAEVSGRIGVYDTFNSLSRDHSDRPSEVVLD